MDPEDREKQKALFSARAEEPLWPAGQGPERRLEFLRPRQFVALRDECPVLYVPLGTIEWHGRHMPLGNDALAELPPLPQPLVAIGGIDPRKEASPALGHHAFEVMVRNLGATVRRILETEG